MITLITGGPRTGKTTLANRMQESGPCRVYHTDDYRPLDWSDQAIAVENLINMAKDGDVIEGVTVVRALRGMLCNPHVEFSKFRIIRLREKKAALTTRQLAMEVSHDAIWASIYGRLILRGAKIEEPI